MFESSDVISELFKHDSPNSHFGKTKSTLITTKEKSLRNNNRIESRLLKLDLNTARDDVIRTRCGHVRPMARSATQSRLSSYLEDKTRPRSVTPTSRWTKLQNVMKFARLSARKHRPASTSLVPTSSQSTFRKKIPPIVSQEEQDEQYEKISELRFRMSFTDSINQLKL